MKKDEYKYIFLANIGTNDLQIQPSMVSAGEKELPDITDPNFKSLIRYAKRKVNPQKTDQLAQLSKPYRDGETILTFFDWFKDKIDAPILIPALTRVLLNLKQRARQDTPISRAYLFATDQRRRDFDKDDTIHCAQVLCQLFKTKRFAETDGSPISQQIGHLDIQRIDDSPARYDQMWSYFGQILPDLFWEHEAEIEAVYISLSGGPPACNFALMLNALQLWGERCIPVYTERPLSGELYGRAIIMEAFGRNLLDSMTMMLGDLELLKQAVNTDDVEVNAKFEDVQAHAEQLQAKVKQGVNKKEVAKSGEMSALRRFMTDLSDESTKLGKTLKGVGKGVRIAQDVAGYYNAVAQWCGLPQVPTPLVEMGRKGEKS